jgi:hypothetical protein
MNAGRQSTPARLSTTDVIRIVMPLVVLCLTCAGGLGATVVAAYVDLSQRVTAVETALRSLDHRVGGHATLRADRTDRTTFMGPPPD